MKRLVTSLTILIATSSTFSFDNRAAKSQSILDWETITVVNRTGIDSCNIPGSTNNCLNQFEIHGKDLKNGRSEKVADFPIKTTYLNPKGISEKNGVIYFNTNQIQNGSEKQMVYSMNLSTLEFTKIKDGVINESSDLIFTPTSFEGGGNGKRCTQVGSGNQSILVCPANQNKPKGIYLENKPLIGKTTNGEIHIGENSLITVEENGRQKLYAQDADGNAIPIDITEGSDLLINGTSVVGSINDNADDIETNRKNINDLGDGVAGATALTAALSSLPVASYDAPISCGIGTGGYSSRFAMGLGCASRLSDRLSINFGGSHVFGGSSNYGGGSLGTIAARGGFVFKLGTIQKRSNIDGKELQSKLDEVRQDNASIREENRAIRNENRAIRDENKDLIARLERLEAIALGTTPASELATR